MKFNFKLIIMSKSRKITEAVLDVLNDRGGFDDWWGNIDEDIKEEIEQELKKAVEDNLKN